MDIFYYISLNYNFNIIINKIKYNYIIIIQNKNEKKIQQFIYSILFSSLIYIYNLFIFSQIYLTKI